MVLGNEINEGRICRFIAALVFFVVRVVYIRHCEHTRPSMNEPQRTIIYILVVLIMIFIYDDDDDTMLLLPM